MNITTYFSILQNIVSPEDMVKACKERGYDKLIICDSNTMSGVVQFYKACKKKEIKPIIGVSLKICEFDPSDKGEHNKMYDLYMVAKNKIGYTNLLKLISVANNSENILDTQFQRIARLGVNDLIGKTEGIACIQGVEGSEYAEIPDCRKYTLTKYREIFKEVLVAGEDIAWTDVRYIEDKYKQDLHVLLCTLLKCTFKELPDEIDANLPRLRKYISDEKFHLVEKSEWYGTLSKELINKTESFLSSCEDYEILANPKVPRFDCPDGMSQQEYLTELCRLGWKKRFPTWKDEATKKIYADRVKYELEVLQGCFLDGYFLVVQDYVNWAKRQGWLIGPGRGSAGGSLVAYLLGIIEIDPIKYKLLFERFYSADRSAGGVITLPDIDIDFPKDKRHLVVEYIEQKFGLDRVKHIITFATLKGSGALGSVLKAHDCFSDKQIKSLTKNIPQKDKISDKMQEQDESSILMYVLKNNPDILKPLGTYNEKTDKIEGEYAVYLEQAIRIEGCIKSYGIHASGILISDEPIETIAPLIIEANGDRKICAWEMGDAEAASLVKADILGLKNLDILMEVNQLLLGRSEDQ